jgi:hypothetical protein
MTTRIYRHKAEDGTFIGWRAEVTIDKTTSYSREPTPEEVTTAEIAEQRAARVAEFAAADALREAATDPDVDKATADVSAKAAKDKATDQAHKLGVTKGK